MTATQLFVKALCVTLCLASSPSSNEEIARDFIEHVLRIPNPDKVLNSVLGRLERNRQQGLTRQRAFDEDCEEPSELLPEYTETLQASRDRELRQLGVHVQKHYPICHLERKIKKLNTNEYEYRPAYYEEVRCTMAPSEEIGVTNETTLALGIFLCRGGLHQHINNRHKEHSDSVQLFVSGVCCAPGKICSSLGFACVQWNKTIHLTRRRYSSDCWETRTMVIPAGCECMWPVHRLGDMKLHV